MSEQYDVSQLFEEFKSKVYRLSLSFSKNEVDAQDITQNTFIKIFKNIDKFKGESKISTWIYRITVNEALQLQRKRKREKAYTSESFDRPVSLDDSDGDDSMIKRMKSHTYDEIVADEVRERVEKVISDMPLKYRSALLLKDAHDFSMEEAAAILNLNVSSFKTRLHRARERVRRSLEAYQQDKSAKIKATPHVDEKTCSVFMPFIQSYAADAVSDEDARAFKKHIDDCEPCKKFIVDYKKAISAVNVLQCKDIPEPFQKKLLSFIRKRET